MTNKTWTQISSSSAYKGTDMGAGQYLCSLLSRLRPIPATHTDAASSDRRLVVAGSTSAAVLPDTEAALLGSTADTARSPPAVAAATV
jgi:hypothetical protein